MEVERRELEDRKNGELAKALGEALPGESQQELDQLAADDRQRAERDLVELRRGDEVWFKHIDELTREDRQARIEAQRHRIDWVQERKAFGRPIGEFQMTQAKIADMRTRLEAARLLTLSAACAKANARESIGRYSTEASMAKLFASETAMFIAHQAVQIHAGMGCSKEMPIERYFRDAKITEIYEGTSEIQRLVIARHETGLR